MVLEIKDPISGKTILLDQIITEASENFFFTLFNSDDIENKFYVEYVLGLHSDYKDTDYSLHLFKSHTLNSENDIFQVYEKDTSIRIGWIFPIQSLVSNEHNYRDNIHFLKYAYVAFLKLLTNAEKRKIYIPNFNPNGVCKLTDFYGDDLIILTLCDAKWRSINNFNIESYAISLYQYGYYSCEPTDTIRQISGRSAFLSLDGLRINLQRISPDLEGEVYLGRLFKSLLKTEENPLVRFYILYQVIELIIERILEKEFHNLISTFNANPNKNFFELKEDISKLSSEKNRISRLVHNMSQHMNANCRTNLQLFCDDLLSSFNTPRKDDLALSLYTARSFIVHKFRNLPEADAPKIESINREFEAILIDILLNYEEE